MNIMNLVVNLDNSALSKEEKMDLVSRWIVELDQLNQKKQVNSVQDWESFELHELDVQKNRLTRDEYHDSPYDLDDPLHHLNDPARWDQHKTTPLSTKK